MNVFYELTDCVVSNAGGKYFAAYNVERIPYGERMACSDRAWCEHDDGSVYLIKHRSLNPIHTIVDMKEFFWIKLKSKTI